MHSTVSGSELWVTEETRVPLTFVNHIERHIGVLLPKKGMTINETKNIYFRRILIEFLSFEIIGI